MRMIIPVSLLLVVLGATSGCLGGDEGGEPAETTTSPMVAGNNTTTPAVPTPKSQTFSLTDVGASIMDIQPDEYSASLNDSLIFNITAPNTNRLSHNFVIEEFAVQVTGVAPGQSKSVDFTASRSGTFAYYCNIDNHRQLGMEGTLTIS